VKCADPFETNAAAASSEINDSAARIE